MTSRSQAAAYFYCDYKDAASHQSSQILGSLVRQLAKQDETSFARAEKVFGIHGQGQTASGNFEPEILCELILEMAADYDCTMIVVDALDECGTNTRDLTELLSNLNRGHDEADVRTADIRTIFLSRDEIDIRQCLQDRPQISIAAQSSDLKLFVGAEIDTRIRQRKLNLRSNELKDHISERLVEGAEGM